MNIRLLSNKDDLDRCIEIIDSLQDWFDDEDKKDIVFSLQKLPTYLYISNDKIIGFICINLNLKNVTEIKYLAINFENRNNGIGKDLIKYIQSSYPKNILVVKTLDESNPYEPYQQTRKFYENLGFNKIDVIENYPGWSPGCPCAIYIKIDT